MHNFNDAQIVLISCLVFLAVFFICRELICWYYKINKHIRLEQEILDTLHRIEHLLNTPQSTPSSTPQSDPTPKA